MRQLGRSIVVGLLALLGAGSARAIDHQDAPGAAATPASDLADLFGWMSSDGSKVILAMTVHPSATAAAKFATDTLYVFHTSSRAALTSTSAVLVDIVCAFDTSQRISCMVGDPSVTLSGDASTPTGLALSNGKLKVFAGLRRDPSFISIPNFDAMKTAAKTALTTASPADPAGCKATPGRTAVTALGNMSGTNTFGATNVLALVMEVDRTLLSKGGPILGVWGATHKKAKTN